MKIRSIAVLCISLLAGMMLQGCATPKTPPEFPDPQSAVPAGGVFANADNLRNVAPGVTKDQMYELLGPPHFHEWFVGGHVWNYLLEFRRGGETVACQYQVQFDEHMRVSRTYWRDPSCAEFLRLEEPTSVSAVTGEDLH